MKSLDGGTWVDIFGAIVLIRMIAPLFKLPPMNMAEAGIWSATIASFAATNIGGPKQL
jgi:hypothetical protein